jgi:hypothetical protein
MATKATCPKGMYWDPSSQKCVKPGTENSPLDLLKKEKERILKTKLKNGGSMKKMQKGGAQDIVDAMYKAQGKKAPTTKKTLKYVKKNGSGYLPPAGKKMQAGGTNKKSYTPFEYYMKTTPGATASDTSQAFTGNINSGNPKLDKAYYDTYYAGRESEKRTGRDEVRYDEQGKRVRYKTGGMVNPNAKIQAAKSAGSKGVKSGVNPKAVAAKKATGKSSGGVDTPPKTAIPKAQFGMSTGKPINENAAKRKASKGKGHISYRLGDSTSGSDKGKYIPYTKAGRKEAKSTGMISSGNMKKGRMIQQKGGTIKKGY